MNNKRKMKKKKNSIVSFLRKRENKERKNMSQFPEQNKFCIFKKKKNRRFYRGIYFQLLWGFKRRKSMGF
jgi:hypothetical protein